MTSKKKKEKIIKIIIVIFVILILLSLFYDFATNKMPGYDWFPDRWRFN